MTNHSKPITAAVPETGWFGRVFSPRTWLVLLLVLGLVALPAQAGKPTRTKPVTRSASVGDSTTQATTSGEEPASSPEPAAPSDPTSDSEPAPEPAASEEILPLIVTYRSRPAKQDEVAITDLGGFPAAFVNILAVFGAALVRNPRPKVEKLAFNSSALVVSTFAGCHAYHLLGGISGGPLTEQFVPLAAAATAYFVVNTFLVSVVITLDRGDGSFFTNWSKSGLWTGVSAYVGLTLAGCLLLILQTIGPIALALGVPPCWMILKFYRSHKEKIETQQKELDRVVDQNVQLEEMVAERTAELEDSNRHLIEANRGLEQANKAKGAFLANMSHELRTPLNAIIGFSDLIRQGTCGPVNEEQVDHLKDIHDSGHHLLGLINDILDLSKIEAGRLEVNPEDVGLREAVQGAAGMLRIQSGNKKQEFTVDCPEEPLAIRVDPGMFRQILVNILSNAVKFTPEGGAVTLEAVRRDSDLVVHVRDSGIGIAPEHLESIFQEFYQVDGTYSRNYEGTGLGLALVRRLVELHGGTITVESEQGKGTTFTLAFPDCVRLQENVEPKRDQADKQVHDFRGKRVLVVEDNRVNRKLAVNLLRSRGFEVEGAETGEDALKYMRRQLPDLVLMDIQLPGIDGLEVTRIIKADPDMAHVPVVALSAHAMAEHKKQAAAAGCDGYITKPIHLGRLAIDLAVVLVTAGNRRPGSGSSGPVAAVS